MAQELQEVFELGATGLQIVVSWRHVQAFIHMEVRLETRGQADRRNGHWEVIAKALLLHEVELVAVIPGEEDEGE